jgi:hypothetical protein
MGGAFGKLSNVESLFKIRNRFTEIDGNLSIGTYNPPGTGFSEFQTNSREVDNQLREYNILYNKIIKNVSFSSNISKWLESRFNQIFVNSLITSSCLKSLNEQSYSNSEIHFNITYFSLLFEI